LTPKCWLVIFPSMTRTLTTVREVIAAIGPVREVARLLGVTEEALYIAIKRNRLDPRHYFTALDHLPPDVDVERALFRRGGIHPPAVTNVEYSTPLTTLEGETNEDNGS
jgi:hypothetical protein